MQATGAMEAMEAMVAMAAMAVPTEPSAMAVPQPSVCPTFYSSQYSARFIALLCHNKFAGD